MIMDDPVSENEKMPEEPKSEMVHHNGSSEGYPTETGTVNSNTDQDQTQIATEAVQEVATVSDMLDNVPAELEETKQSMKESKVEVTKKTSALMNIMEYDDDEWTDISSDVESEKILVRPQVPRKTTISESSDTTESDISEHEKSESADSDVELVSVSRSCNNNDSFRKQEVYPNTYGEILPPVADLSNLVIDDNEDFLHIGNVHSIVETVVTISSVPDSPAYDLETVLFIEKGPTKIPLGEIFDVIGPVNSPFYCVRIQSESDIKEKEIKSGITKVFSIPRSSRTHYIFVKQLMDSKHTDASGENDEELNTDDTSDEDTSDDQPPPNRRRKRTDHGSQGESSADRQAQEQFWHSTSYVPPPLRDSNFAPGPSDSNFAQGPLDFNFAQGPSRVNNLMGQQRVLPPFVDAFNHQPRPPVEPRVRIPHHLYPHSYWTAVFGVNNFAVDDDPNQNRPAPRNREARPAQRPANPQQQEGRPPPAHIARPFYGEMHNPRHPRDPRQGNPPAPPNPMNLHQLGNPHRGPGPRNINRMNMQHHPHMHHQPHPHMQHQPHPHMQHQPHPHMQHPPQMNQPPHMNQPHMHQQPHMNRPRPPSSNCPNRDCPRKGPRQ